MFASIALSKLVAGKVNPRRVKPAREAHRRMMATIKSFQLINPLVVKAVKGKGERYEVIAGKRTDTRAF